MTGESKPFSNRAADQPGARWSATAPVGLGPTRPGELLVGRQRGRQLLEHCAEPLARGAELHMARLLHATIDALTRLRRVDAVRRWSAQRADTSVWAAYQAALRAEFAAARECFVTGKQPIGLDGAGGETELVKLQLVGYGEQEISAFIERAAARIRNMCFDALASVQRRLAALAGEPEIPLSESPLRPAVFCLAFCRTLRAAGVPNEDLPAALRECEGSLGEVAAGAYEAIDKQLADAGLSAEVVMTVSRPPATRTYGFDNGMMTRSGLPSRGGTSGGAAAGTGSNAVAIEEVLRALYERMQLIAPLVAPEPAAGAGPAPVADRRGGPLPALGALAARSTGGAPSSANLGASGQSAEQAFFEALDHVRMRASAMATGERAGPSVLLAGVAADDHTPELLEAARRQLDKLTIQLVGMLFDRIAQDRFIPEPIKELLRELQYPMMKVAVADPALFTEPEQPARQLMDRIASTSVGWTPGGEDNERYHAEVRKAVQLVVEEIDRGAEAFAQALDGFEKYLAEERSRDDDPVARAKKALADAEAREIMAINAMIRIRSAFEGMQVESYLREFLLNTWPRVLAAVWQRDRGDDARIQRYLDAVPDLLWSVQPKTSQEDRRRLVSLIPAVLSMVREGLDLIDMPAADRQAFYARLMTSHVQAVKALELAYGHAAGSLLGFDEMRDKLAGLSLPAGLPTEDEVTVEVPAEIARRALESAQIDSAVDLLGRPGPRDVPTQARPETGDADTEVRLDAELQRWRRGDWFDLEVDGQTQRVCLRWISPRRSFYLFQPADGARAHSLPARALRDYLRSGALRIAGHAPLFDRLIEGLVEEQRNAQVAAPSRPPARAEAAPPVHGMRSGTATAGAGRS